MSGKGETPLSELMAATREFLTRDERQVDLKAYRAIIDALKREFASSPHISDASGENAEAEE